MIETTPTHLSALRAFTLRCSPLKITSGPPFLKTSRISSSSEATLFLRSALTTCFLFNLWLIWLTYPTATFWVSLSLLGCWTNVTLVLYSRRSSRKTVSPLSPEYVQISKELLALLRDDMTAREFGNTF